MPTDERKPAHIEATCPHCGFEGVPVRSGRVGLHAPLRMGAKGAYVAKGESCGGLGMPPEYPGPGRPRQVA